MKQSLLGNNLNRERLLWICEGDKRFSSSEEGVDFWNAKIEDVPIVFGALLIVIWEKLYVC
jgi:hypothetical protein